MSTAPSPPAPTVHRWDATWRSFAAVQGGVVVGALLSSALACVQDHGRPGQEVRVRTAATHLLAPVVPDADLEVRSVPERLGATSSIRVEARQAGVLCAVAQVLLSSSPAGAPAEGPVPVPELPADAVGPAVAEELVLPVAYVPMSQHLEFRVVGTGRPLAGGSEPRLTVWCRVRASAGVTDPLVALGLVVDALPPSLFAVRTEPAALPTVELTMHLVGPPPPVGAWVRVDQRTAWSDGWSCVDEADLHDEQGRLVATARQSRRLPRG
jgi:acyl-CoA thioesterase